MRYAATNCSVKSEQAGTVTFTGPCFVTGKPYSVTVLIEGIRKYNAGAMMQDAFPLLSAGDREFLISGTSPEGWKKLFDGKEE